MTTPIQETSTMKAVVRNRFGPPDVLDVRELEQPTPLDDGVVVRVRAASLNRADWYEVRGRPWLGRPMMGLRRPKSERVGTDFAGTVVAVGRDVTRFQPGDEVFGGGSGSLAEYVRARVPSIASKPAHVSFEEAAAVPIAGLTALQALRDHGRLKPGDNVLVNGASGGVGTFAIQIAKALGAQVTAVCSTRNVDQARLLGADQVVDYTREDFTRSDQRYDLLFDNAGNRSFSACKRVLAPQATIVLVGGSMTNPLLGPLGHILRFRLRSMFGSRKAAFFVAKFNAADLDVLRELLETSKVSPAIDRRYELSEVADALRYLGEGHARGKVVLTV
jgi:NADPH:quinone reductase-like Zn-dependent oxidoreductase